MLNFKTYIKEAFSNKSFEKVCRLMQNYLERKLGEDLYLYPENEEFKKSDGTVGIGQVYYTNSGKKIRFNWTQGTDNSEVSSIDLWVMSKTKPDFIIDAEGESVAKFLPKAAEIIKSPRIGTYDINESFISEGRAAHPKTDNAIELLSQGMSAAEVAAKTKIPIATVYAIKRKNNIGTISVKKAPSEIVKTPKAINKAIAIAEDDAEIFKQKMNDLSEIAIAVGKRMLPSLLVSGKAGVGKTFSITKVLEKNLGLQEGKDWQLIKAGISPAGAYQQLFKWRKKVIVFDDADGIFKDDEGRNLLKAALDDKKRRKITWPKLGKWLEDVDPRELDEDPSIEADMLEQGKYPKEFFFEGSVVFISNMTKNKIDPDGALRSRSMVIDVNPSNMAILERIESLLDVVGVDDYPAIAAMSLKEKKEVFAVVKRGIEQNPDTPASIRKLVKALNIKAMGIPDWERITEQYS